MKYLYDLLDLLNDYSGEPETENTIRDLICFLAEDDKYKDNELFKSLLFETAQKLRMFGYIKINEELTIDNLLQSDFSKIENQVIQNYYKSKVFSNNILDRRQKEVVNKFMSLEKKRILVSAPTSFGKTFILREIVFLNQKRYNKVLFVFPTVALLNENTNSMSDLVSSLNLDYKIINNVYTGVEDSERIIFILTPERTLKLLADNPGMNIDFFFFDEVYKIDEDFSKDEDSVKDSNDNYLDESYSKEDLQKSNRSKAFRICLYLLSKRIDEYYLAGPYLNLKNIGKGMQRFVDKNHINLMQFDFEPTMRIEIETWKKKWKVCNPVLGEYQETPIQPDNENLSGKKCIIFQILDYVKQNNYGQTLFYCATPAKTIEYTKQLSELFKDTYFPNKISKNFITHLRKRYNVKLKNQNNSSEYWSLITALEHGYGIHHGKFPKYIQHEILRMFNKGQFDYLFCTSTIIEGVNTNARNVVIINNSIGNSSMTGFALKNIKGRAGRYYHNYIGRVFYTELKQRRIESASELRLDFKTFSESRLSVIDIDSTHVADLQGANSSRKLKRERTFTKDFLPDSVFEKNRLFDRKVQEEYLHYLCNSHNFNKFSNLIGKTSSIRFFLQNRMMNKILESLEEIGVLEKNKASIYHAVANQFSFSGTKGILEYHISKVEKAEEFSSDKIDKAYIDAFKQIRTIIEYEIPKLLCLFESLFIRAGELHHLDMSEFNMSIIIRFYELGITTELGLFLVEYGFPIDTIRELERKFQGALSLPAKEAASRLMQDSRLLETIDNYEYELFVNALNVLNKRK